MATDSNKPKIDKCEKRTAYLLVAPALILILVIAIYPVLQSFYFSLFDLRLNDPQKADVHLNYNVDLEQYFYYYPFLVDDLTEEVKAANGTERSRLKKIKQNLQGLDQNIRKDAKENYQKVKEIHQNFESPSTSLSVVKISDKTAKSFQSTIEKVNKQLKQISNDNELKNEKDVIGLANGLKGVIFEPNYIGFHHYAEELKSSRMWSSLWNTVFFTIVSVFIEFVLGLAIALLINKAFFGRGLIRATVLIPWAIPTAVSALMWKFLYDGQYGVVAKFFSEIGLLDHMSALLSSKAGAMFSVILSDVWKTTPYIALLLLAGLQVIPKSLYEAASIDGASKWKQFTNITLPMLKLSILVALLFRTLDAFRVFDLIYVLTGGGPANSTETISILAYKVMFSQTNFGAGSALSVIVFICVAFISMIFVKVLGSDLLPESSKK